jgi:RNA-directed DNA polymerase
MIIKDNIHISRPMVFLCGPYFEDKPHDRRKILREYLNSEANVLPIIVDKILDKKNIKDDTVNIDLIEEICAAVSLKTYIFLDTFSSVAELGMFCSGAYKNQIDVFIPKRADVITNNIGVFINEIINNPNNEKIKCYYYRPKIVRVPLASEYVVEFYEFTRNELPQNIKDRIQNDEIYNISDFGIAFEEGIGNTEENGVINYSVKNDKITFNISVRMLFYLVASILLENKRKTPDEIESELKELLKNSFSFYKNINISEFHEVQINTRIINELQVIIKHILVFIKLYNTYGDSKGKSIVTKQDSLISDGNTYISITKQDRDLIGRYLTNPNEFIETIKIKRGRKIRSISKYKDDENGNELRKLHETILHSLQELYEFSDNSFAYRKGFSILSCALPHKESVSFLKMDIKSFFNSITFNELYKCAIEVVDKSFIEDKHFRNLLRACMYNGNLPLGLITSPMLSDIYLHKFDKTLVDILRGYNKGIIFTRYADDMIFSSKQVMDDSDIHFLTRKINEQLERIKLNINEEKTITKNLTDIGDHIKILGLNIVKSSFGNEITVGKTYINDTAVMALELFNKQNLNEISDETEFYSQKTIAGRLAYIKQIEGLKGLEKLRRRILKSIHNNLHKSNDKINYSFLIALIEESINRLKDDNAP